MYPISLGFEEAERRINALIANGHSAEALITSVFSLEKTLRRALRFCAISRGFSSAQAQTLFEHKGFKDLTDIWPCYEKFHRSLPEFIGNDNWQHIKPAVQMRNKLAHGEQVYKLEECKLAAENTLNALRAFRLKLKVEILFDGWSRLPVRKIAVLRWLTPLTNSVENLNKVCVDDPPKNSSRNEKP